MAGHFGSGTPNLNNICPYSFRSCIMIVPGEILAMRDIVQYWPLAKNVHSALWIIIFTAFPFAFNLLYVRRYGEFEYWITMIKVVTLIVIILLGILLPLGATGGPPLLATNGIEPVLCESVNSDCLLSPGFNCTFFRNTAKFRLERRPFQRDHRHRIRRRSCRILGVLL